LAAERFVVDIRGTEEPYQFSDVWRLMADFKHDVKKIRRRNWDED
jgi:hypothetical protein